MLTEFPTVQLPLFNRYCPLPELHSTDSVKLDSLLQKVVLFAELMIVGVEGIVTTLIVTAVRLVWQVRLPVTACSRAT